MGLGSGSAARRTSLGFLSSRRGGSQPAAAAGFGLDTPIWMGVYESAADEEHVWVRVDDTDEVVRARLARHAPDYEFEPGDELGLEVVDGAWHTIPNVSHVIRHRDRVEFFTTNRRTGDFRLLAENRREMGAQER